ncbi:MAG TPA: glycosyltransferase family 4 protein [Candidatus Acidoferrales bacterium]|nr:glycosyltransferase family 4 protein [Candidatus Acidoferrales bacterium]
MKILQLSPRIPYPLTEGGSIGIFNITRQLSERGALIYFVAVSGNRDTDCPKELSKLCQSVLVTKASKRYSFAAAARNLFSPVPINVEKYHSRKILKEIISFASDKQIDLIHVDHLHMAYYGLALGKLLMVPVALREHNLELKIMERFSESSGNPAYRAYAKSQMKKFLKYEPSICAQMDKCVMITEQDRDRLLSMRRDVDAVVIPAGVDTDFFKPADSIGDENTIIYVGGLDWLPNIDGLKWFVDEVMPIITESKRNVRLIIYGKGDPRSVDRLGNGKNVIVEGYIHDVRQAFMKGRVMVVPLLAGSGIRIRILEAMAAGKPIVTTSIGSEGIKIEPGKNIMIADTANQFAEKVLLLLNDENLCRTVSKEAGSFVSSEYSWHRIGDMFWRAYNEIIDKRAKSSRDNARMGS